MELRGFRILLWKRYFDTGFGLLNYVKYLIMFIGLNGVLQNNINFAMGLVVLYAVICFFTGWAYINYGFWETEQEIINRFNPFQQQIRKKFAIPNK